MTINPNILYAGAFVIRKRQRINNIYVGKIFSNSIEVENKRS